MSTKLKVFHILEYSPPNISGYSLRSDAIIRHQQEIGITTFQLTSQRYQEFSAMSEDIAGVCYQRTIASTSLLSRIPLISSIHHINHLASRIEHLVKQEKPDVIQAHSPMFNAIAAYKVGKKYGIPVTYEVRALWEDAAVDTGKTTEGSLKYRLIKAIENYAFYKVNMISCICQGLRQDLIKRGIPAEKVFVTPNAVDLKKFRAITTRDTELECKYHLQGKKVLAFVGSFFKYEGLATAINAMKIIQQQRCDIHLLLVGAGNEDSSLKELTEKLGLTRAVTFTGRVPFSDVSRFYSLADAMLFPRESIRLTELVTPLKPLESMAQYKPVFASDIGGHRELIQHEKTGILFKADSAQALANSVLTYIDNQPLLNEIVEAGLHYVQTERSWLNTAKQYLPVYRSLTGAS